MLGPSALAEAHHSRGKLVAEDPLVASQDPFDRKEWFA